MNLTFAYLAQNSFFESVEGLRATTTPPTPLLLTFTFFLTVLLLAALNTREGRIRKRLASADALVEKLEKDSRLLVLGESEFKNQVSHFLHDRVQSSLMVTSMRLQKMAENPKGASRGQLQDIIDDLEKLRMQDLRLTIESLSPNLEANELQGLIQSLVPQSLETSSLTVEMPSDTTIFPTEVKMAIFKISEQAILNALMHGSAKNIFVTLAQSAQGSWRLEIRDDGITSTADDSKPGLGTAIIDSWTRIIDGQKTINASGEDGYTLEVSLTVDSNRTHRPH